MKSYEASTVIEASADNVWAVLAHYSGYTDWDSGVLALTGEPILGGKVELTAAVSPKRPFKLKVTELDRPKRMVWSGGMPLGLFRGVRTFQLEAVGSATRVRVREEFTGPLVGLVWKSMPDLQPSFDQFVNGLKREVESRGGNQ